MTTDNLKIIKGVYDGLLAGVSNPITINTAYSLLPNHVDGSPMRAKIVAINRFMMLNYTDELQAIKKAESQPKRSEGVTESIGTIENLKKQSHQESSNDDMATEQNENRQFLTKEQKESLKDNTSNTTLEMVSSDGKKKRTRKPRG